MQVPDGPSVGLDTENEKLPPYSVWYYIDELGRQLDSRRFRLMRFKGDRLNVRDEIDVARDTAVCAPLRR